MFALVAMLMMSCVPAFATPGAAVKPEKHAVLKAAAVQAAHEVASVNVFFDVAALPGLANMVPKTKVYGLHKYFGMTVRSDISHRYRSANILFKSSPNHQYLDIPPLITG